MDNYTYQHDPSISGADFESDYFEDTDDDPEAEVTHEPYKDIPLDAWAFRLSEWRNETGEKLYGEWHRTQLWVRRGGTYAGLVSVCNRVYTLETMQLVGAPNQHPIGALCAGCFGIDHSDKIMEQAP